MKEYPAFGPLLQKYLTDQDRSASWLARQLDCNAATVNRWLNHPDMRPGNIEMLTKLADCLNIQEAAERQALFAAAGYGYAEPPKSTPTNSNSTSAADVTPIRAPYDFFAYEAEAWVGRDTLVRTLSQHLQDSRRIVMLVGMAGIGKTALAERLAVELKSWLPAKPHTEYRLNFDHQQRKTSFATVALQWLHEWGQPVDGKEASTPELLIERLTNLLRHQRHLVIIDALEKILTNSEEGGANDFTDPGWNDFFHSLLSAETLESRVILTSQDVPVQLDARANQYRTRWERRRLSGLTEAERLELFEKVGLRVEPASPDAQYLARLAAIYDGHPLALRTIAGEILNDYGGNVTAYWREYGREVEAVEQDLLAARQAGAVQGATDNWRLDRYSVQLQRHVRSRLDGAFQRLEERAPEAYQLLCILANYRTLIKERTGLYHLGQAFGYTPETQKAALQALRDRCLIEDSTWDPAGNRLIGLHNLIRSIALEHAHRLFPDEEPSK
ncbi:MAG: NB-ARC domain-containing protein [Caldilineaceae bacterium]